MAKKRKSKDLFPKKIAGVKVPKKVRQGRFGELLASPTGQALIAQAVAGAGAIAAGLKAKDSPKIRRAAHNAKDALADTGDDARGKAGEIKDKAGEMSASLAYAIGEAARTFADALQRGEPRTFQKAASEADEPDWTSTYGASDPGWSALKKESKAHDGETRSRS